MTALVHPNDRDCVNSLGIPVDNLSLSCAVDRIIEMAKNRDGRSRLVSTLNVDFLVNALGRGVVTARHPELLHVLRNSDLVTADGFPIIWLSRLIGKPLRERVCGSDLAPALSRRASREGLSLFLLGGGEGIAAAAAAVLQGRNPGLCIAGVAAPMVSTAGPGLASCFADDEQLVREINESGADILLVGLGNPKQELWFNRNRDSLEVPVSIGVGGTFEFITGTVKRAPRWIQRINMEWFYRIIQDPARLWRRYTRGFFKLAWLCAPLVITRVWEILVFAGRGTQDQSIVWSKLWSSREQSLVVLRLPRVVTGAYLEELARQLRTCPPEASLRMLDFSAVKHVELAAHQAFFYLGELQRRDALNLKLMGVSEKLRRQLAASRVLDVVGSTDHTTINTLGQHSGSGDGTLNCRSYVLKDCSLIFLAGTVDRQGLEKLGFVECISDMSRHRDCIIDLRDVVLLENSGIAALQPFLTKRTGATGGILFSGTTANTRQMFRVAELVYAPEFIDDRQLLAVIGGRGLQR